MFSSKVLIRNVGLTLMLCLGLFLPAQAQDIIPDDEWFDQETLVSPVVISATGYEQDIYDAPASITIITREQLEERPFNDLSDALRDVPGISYIGGNGNERDISIRGLSGDYVLILVDGKRQGTRESRPNGSGGFEASWIPPLSAIERIEVIRGPMSALYGSDAMGGVINIITRKDTQHWRGTVGVDYTLQEHSKSGNIANANFFLGGPLVRDRLAIQLYGGGHFREEDDIVSGYSENDNRNINGRLLFTPWENHLFNLDGGLSQQERASTVSRTIEHTDSATSSASKHTRKNWGIGYDGTWAHALTKFNYYYEVGKRDTGGDRKPEVTNNVADAMVTIPSVRNMFTLGGQYKKSKLTDDSRGQNGTESITIDAYQWALFAEDEFSILRNLILTGGVRLDKHEHFGSNWSPRGYIVFHPTSEFTIKGGVSTAFNAPSLRQLDPNYGYATNGGRAVMYGDPDLKPEKSVSEEIGIIYHKDNGFEISATFFYTDFKDKLTNYNTGETDPLTGLQLFKHTNMGRSYLMGVETGLNFPLGIMTEILRDLNLSGSYTYIHSERLSTDELFSGTAGSTKGYALTMTPKHKFDVRLDWQVIKDLNTYALLEYIGKQEYVGLRTGYAGPRHSRPLTTIDLGAAYYVTDDAKVSFAVLNLTDQRRDPKDATGADWETIQDGRRYWLGTTINF